MNAQLKKGILEMCLLYKLSQRDYYGYDLVREIQSLFPEVKDSTYYAILRRLYAEGKASVYEGKESGGPTRKYYRLTKSGEDALLLAKRDWALLKERVGQLGL